MAASILTSVKQGIGGIAESYTAFDADIIMHINSVLNALTQMGVGPDTGFSIEDSTATWSDFLEDDKMLEMVKSYVVLKVRTIFDPPQNGTLAEAFKNNLAELEWRINAYVDYTKS